MKFQKKQSLSFDNFYLNNYFPGDDNATYAQKQEFYQIIKFLDDPNLDSKNCLDIGCGVGRFSLSLAKLCNTVVGIDISEIAICYANKTASEFKINNFEAFLNNFSIPTAVKYDYIFCINSLHHTESIENILINAHLSLRDNGKLIIIENNPLNIFFQVLFIYLKQFSNHLTKSYYQVNRFTLKHLLTKNSFAINKTYRHAFLPTSLYNKFRFFEKINAFLNRIPLLNEHHAFYFIMATKLKNYDSSPKE